MEEIRLTAEEVNLKLRELAIGDEIDGEYIDFIMSEYEDDVTPETFLFVLANTEQVACRPKRK